MTRRWGVLIGVVVGAVAIVPLATAGAEAPSATVAETPTAPEGSIPPGGTVNCTTSATLDPDHGPPGTVVTVSTTFMGNCDDVNPIFLEGMTCTGLYQLEGQEAVAFPMTVDPETGDATGTFTAPATAPDPPVHDAIEPITVTVQCQVPNQQLSPGAEGGTGGTTYNYPPAIFSLELFADEGQQPTLVEDDAVDNAGVVGGTPTFTG